MARFVSKICLEARPCEPEDEELKISSLKCQSQSPATIMAWHDGSSKSVVFSLQLLPPRGACIFCCVQKGGIIRAQQSVQHGKIHVNLNHPGLAINC